MSNDITISGLVQSYEQRPIHIIQVTIYRNEREVKRVYTDEEGRYSASVPRGTSISVRFDVHSTLINASDWHPSVVSNINAEQDISLDRVLMAVGTGGDEFAVIDALAAYQFCAFWNSLSPSPNGAYAEYAASRVMSLKPRSELMQEIQRDLAAHFNRQAT